MAEDIFKEEDEQDKLEQQVENLEAIVASLNPRNLAGLKSKELKAAVRANIFGDGSDGNVEISANTTLTRDMFYDSLTINASYTLSPDGFRIFVKDDLINRGTIDASGGAGSDGADYSTGPGGSPGGAGGTAGSTDGSIAGGVAGGAGASGDVTGGQDGSDSVAGIDTNPSIGSAGAQGGSGGGSAGAGGGSGGDGGAVGDSTAALNVPRSPQSAYLLIDAFPSIAAIGGSSGSTGGGSGGAYDSGPEVYSGAGGGAGGSGGMIYIAANRLINEGVISANGGDGGDGGDGLTTSAGPGGGGAGGSGGVLIQVYGIKSGSGTESVTGGTGGNSGANGTGGDTGGTGGNAGVIYNIEIG